MNPYPPRFSTKKKALRFLQLVRERKPIPEELTVPPFRMNGEGRVVANKAYDECRYEFRLIPNKPIADSALPKTPLEKTLPR